MSTGKEIVAIALALTGWIIAIVACFLPMWKVSAVTEAGTGRAQTIWEGLWMSCVMKSTGQMQCTAYDSMEALPSDLQAAQNMTVIAIITAPLLLMLSFMGANYTNCIKDRVFKAKVMIISWVFFIIAGFLVLIPVYYTTIQFYQHRDLGASLYFGFAAAALLFIGGVLLCCNCPSQERRPSISSHHSKRMKIVGFALCLTGWILSIVTCILPMWKVSTYFGFNIVEGLWITCVVQSTGHMQCKVYDPMLVPPSDLQYACIMTVISIFTALLALIILIIDLTHFTGCIMSIKDKASKAQLMMIVVVFFIISSILVLISVCLTTNTIIQDSYYPILILGQNRDLGASLYIGFAAAALLIISGVLLCYTCLVQGRR